MDVEDKTKIPLVFIHGYKGCHLRNTSTNTRDYLTTGNLLSFSSPDLSLPLAWPDGDRQAADSLVPDAPIANMLGWESMSSMFGASGYSTMLKFGRKNFGKEVVVRGHEVDKVAEAELMNSKFFVFCYDWRRDNNETVDQFESFLKKLGAINRLAQVVGHSNGGLVSWAVLRRSPQLFHSILFAGVPFGPSLNFLKDLQMGASNGGLNMKQLNQYVTATHPSVYCFLPVTNYSSDDLQLIDGHHWEDGSKCLLDASGSAISIDWSDAKEWEKHRLGLFAYENGEPITPPTDEMRVFLQRCLDAAKRFREEYLFPDIGIEEAENDNLSDEGAAKTPVNESVATKTAVINDTTVSDSSPRRGSMVSLNDEAESDVDKLPRLAVLIGTEQTTRNKAQLDPGAPRGMDFFTSQLNNEMGGDGRISFHNAKPPRTNRIYELYSSDRGHADLLDDADQLELILSTLRGQGEEISEYYW